MTDPVDNSVIESLGEDFSKVVVLTDSSSVGEEDPTPSSVTNDGVVTNTTIATSSEALVNHLTDSFEEQKSFAAMAQHLEMLLDRIFYVQDRISKAEVSLAAERVAERVLARHMDRGEQMVTQFVQKSSGAVKAERARLRRLEISTLTNTTSVGTRDIITRAKLNNHKAASHLYGAIYDTANVQFSAQLSLRPLALYTLPELEAEVEALRAWFNSAIARLVRSRRVRTLARNQFNPAVKQAPKHLPRLESYFYRAVSWFSPGGIKYDKNRRIVLPSKYSYDPNVNLSLIELRTALCACLQASDTRIQEDFVLVNLQSQLTERFFPSSAPLRMCTIQPPKSSKLLLLNDPLFGTEVPAWTYPTAVLAINSVHSCKRLYAEGLRQDLAKLKHEDGTFLVKSMSLTRTQGLRVVFTDRAHLARIADVSRMLENVEAVVCKHAGRFCCEQCHQKMIDDRRIRRPLNRRSKRRAEELAEAAEKKQMIDVVCQVNNEKFRDFVYYMPTYRHLSYKSLPTEKEVPPYHL